MWWTILWKNHSPILSPAALCVLCYYTFSTAPTLAGLCRHTALLSFPPENYWCVAALAKAVSALVTTFVKKSITAVFTSVTVLWCRIVIVVIEFTACDHATATAQHQEEHPGHHWNIKTKYLIIFCCPNSMCYFVDNYRSYEYLLGWAKTQYTATVTFILSLIPS